MQSIIYNNNIPAIMYFNNICVSMHVRANVYVCTYVHVYLRPSS